MAQESEQQNAASETLAAPVVVERTKKKKKKKKYSKGTKDVQRMERRASKASQRLARAVADGMSTYRKKSSKSARKKRDGAVVDFIPNAAEGLGKSVRVASRVPADLAKAVNTKRVRRQMRAVVRMMRPFR